MALERARSRVRRSSARNWAWPSSNSSPASPSPISGTSMSTEINHFILESLVFCVSTPSIAFHLFVNNFSSIRVMSLVKELARDEALRDKSLMVAVCEEDLFLPLLRQILLSSSGEVHWLREKKYDKLPDLPRSLLFSFSIHCSFRELLSCPERLSRIFFHTGDLVERITHFCSHTTNYSRSPVETLIVRSFLIFIMRSEGGTLG